MSKQRSWLEFLKNLFLINVYLRNNYNMIPWSVNDTLIDHIFIAFLPFSIFFLGKSILDISYV